MKFDIPSILVIGVVIYVLFGDKLAEINWRQYVPNIGSVSSSEEFPSKPTNQTVLEAVEGVRPVLSQVSAGDKLALSRLFREQAKLVAQYPDVVRSTSDIYTANGIAGKLMGFTTRYPGLGDPDDNTKGALSTAVAKVVGDEVAQLDTAKRQAAVDVLNGLSWIMRN